MSKTADPDLAAALEGLAPGCALDLACGGGRHAAWLAGLGWDVTAVDIAPGEIPGVRRIGADLESGEYAIAPGEWGLIVCWLYWQVDLMGAIRVGVRPGGVVAAAGKTTGRFATSLANYRASFAGWTELASGDNGHRVFFVARKP